jgi:hypothetical protein
MGDVVRFELTTHHNIFIGFPNDLLYAQLLVYPCRLSVAVLYDVDCSRDHVPIWLVCYT